jgi:hypothetical protein
MNGCWHIASRYYDRHAGWKRVEQTKLNQVSASMTIEYVKSVMGPPIIQDGGTKYTESIFKEHGYWLQTITDHFNNVQLLTITGCDRNFHPVIKISFNKEIELNITKMASVEQGNVKPHYYIGALFGESSYLIDEQYLASPGNYQTLYTGFTEGCGDFSDRYDYSIVDKNSPHPRDNLNDPGAHVNYNNPAIIKLRQNTTINTIGITAPNINITELRQQFMIGVDYKTISVLPKNN